MFLDIEETYQFTAQLNAALDELSFATEPNTASVGRTDSISWKV